MPTRLPSLIVAAVIFAFAGWMGGAIITAKGGLAGLSGTLMSIEALRAGFLAAAIGVGLGAPMFWIRQRPVAIIGWVAVSSATAALAVWLYYAIWPPQWEAPAYKIAYMVLKGYWKHLIPLAVASGVLIGSLLRAPEEPPEESPIG